MNTPNENLWHYSDGSASFGPLTSSAIRQLMAAKVILPEFTLRRDGEVTSQALAEVDLDAPPAPKEHPSAQPQLSVAPPPPPAATDGAYHLTRNGTNSGPYRVDELRAMIQRREVTAMDLVWKDGMTDWVKIETVADLRVAGSPPPPPSSFSAGTPQSGLNPFQRYYLNVFKKYAVFTGRSTRKEFWMFHLISLITLNIFALLDGVNIGNMALSTTYLFVYLFPPFFVFQLFNVVFLAGISYVMDAYNIGPLSLTYSIIAILPSFAIYTRRMQDANHNGWWLFCPIVNLVFAVQNGTKGPNRFGTAPESNMP